MLLMYIINITLLSVSSSVRVKRLAVSRNQWADRLWPRGLVPYRLGPGFGPHERDIIEGAMREFKRFTCVRFIQWKRHHRNGIEIRKHWGLSSKDCYASVGRIGAVRWTPVQLSSRCLSGVGAIGRVMHELTHVIGFYHEHQRQDKPGSTRSRSRAMQGAYHIGPYDPLSIMHYPEKGVSHGQLIGFSRYDVDKINAMYNCSNTKRDSQKNIQRLQPISNVKLFSKDMIPNEVASLKIKCPSLTPVYSSTKRKIGRKLAVSLHGYCFKKKECNATTAFLVNDGKFLCYGFAK